MGVCCIVFDIDGMLFEFFMNFVNIEFFFFQNFMFSSCFMLFPTFEKKLLKNNIEKCPFTYWLNGRWFLQIVDRDSWNLYPLYPLFPCSDFVSQMWGWFGGGGGVMFFSYFMLFTTFLEKTNLGIPFLAPPAERQRSFSNTDLSVVRLSVCLSVRPSVCLSVRQD